VFKGSTYDEAKVNVHVDQLVNQIVFRKITKPRQIAESMFSMFELVVKDTVWQNASQLKDNLKRLCEMLISKDKMNFVVRNCSERMLRIFNQACKQMKISIEMQHEISTLTSMKQLKRIAKVDQSDLSPSLVRSMTVPQKDAYISEELKSKNYELREHLLTQIREIAAEIDVSRESVTEQAKEHISDNELILTLGLSDTCICFFKEAYEQFKFELVVAESAPTFSGHKTAKKLAECGIPTNLIQDAAIFAVMSRVDKVIISAHGIMATGGIIATSGALMVCHAAKAHSVPVFVLGALYKFTPLHPIDSLTYNEFLSPDSILRPSD
jgi:translation initiation factor eIF-2B subunit beta